MRFSDPIFEPDIKSDQNFLSIDLLLRPPLEKILTPDPWGQSRGLLIA